jgi:hypothetical protein
METMKYLRVQWDRAGAVLALLLGVVAVFLGYLGTAQTEYIAKQIPFLISGGIAGLMLLTVGAVLWLSADLRDEWRAMCKQSEAIRAEQNERRTELREFIAQEIARQSSVGSRSGSSS